MVGRTGIACRDREQGKIFGTRFLDICDRVSLLQAVPVHITESRSLLIGEEIDIANADSRHACSKKPCSQLAQACEPVFTHEWDQ